MAHFDHVIVGGGMSGCLIALALAAWRKGESVAIIEPGRLGGSFAQGGFQYLRSSPGVLALLEAHRLDYSVKTMAGGVLTHKGRVLPYPDGLADHVTRAQLLHYGKTRGTTDGFVPGVMNFGGKGGSQLLVDFSRLIGKVEDAATIIRATATVLSGPMACVGPRQWVESGGGVLISTVPLPILSRLLQLDQQEAPTCPHEWLKVARASVTSELAPLGHYDYTYTPWLKAIHRVRPVLSDDGIDLEFEWNGRNDELSDADLAQLGVANLSSVRTLPGHLHPVEWGTWRPGADLRLAGRFAEWEPRMTVDQVADRWHKELTG